MAVSFLPFLVMQTILLPKWLPEMAEPQSARNAEVLAIAYGLPGVIAILLGLAYVQFYCLMEFSISLRMLDHFLAHPRYELSFRELRREYPLEDVIARKCAAAGNVGLLRAGLDGDDIVLDMSERSVLFIQLLTRFKAYLNWTDAG